MDLQILALMSECARFETDPPKTTDREHLLNQLRDAISEIFGSLAFTLAANREKEGWASDPANPGYLVRTTGEFEVRVPWNLLKDFPVPAALNEFSSIAQRIRSGKDTAICLSGSSALYSSIQPVADIDFCEYVNATADKEDNSFARTVMKATALVDENLVCTALKIHAPEKARALSKRPWETSPAEDEDFLQKAREAEAGKCDFIGKTGAEGIIDVSKIVLFLSDDPEGRSGMLSSPTQEALLSEQGGWVPRRLAEPLTIGRYINRLRQESERLSSGSPDANLAKAAKRALSLTRILFLHDMAERLLKIMRQKQMVLTSAIKSRLDLRNRVQHMQTDPVLAKFEAPLADDIRTLVRDLKDPVLEAPDGPLDDGWFKKVADHLHAEATNDVTARKEIRSILHEVTGLLDRSGYTWR